MIRFGNCAAASLQTNTKLCSPFPLLVGVRPLRIVFLALRLSLFFFSKSHCAMTSWARRLTFPRGLTPSNSRDNFATFWASIHREGFFTVARRQGTSASSPLLPWGVGTGELVWLPAWLPISFNSRSRERDLLGDLERFPTPRPARAATGHGDKGRHGAKGGGNPWARCNVRKIRTFTLQRPCIIRLMLFRWRPSAVERRTGGILELPPMAPCGILN